MEPNQDGSKISTGDKIRKAILDSGQSLYAIAKGAGVPYAAVHTFVNGKGIRLATASKVARHLGLGGGSSDIATKLRLSIKECGLSLYEIAKRSGVDDGGLGRFLEGGNLALDSAGKVADVIGIRLI